VPAGPIQQQDGVRMPCNMTADLVEVKLHGISVGEGKDKRCSRTSRGADGAEQIG